MTIQEFYNNKLFQTLMKGVEETLKEHEVKIDGNALIARGDKITIEQRDNCEILFINDEPFLIEENYKIEDNEEVELNL